MQQIAVLTTCSDTGLHLRNADGRLIAALEDAGCSVGEYRWLNGDFRRGGKAFEAAFELSTASAPLDLLASLRGAFSGEALDVNIVAAENRRKRLLVADMDSTITASESLDDLARLAGRGGEVAAITTRAMQGELDFTEALEERVRMLAGCPADLIQAAVDGAALNPGAAELVATMRHHGARTVLASGGFTFLASVVAVRLGFDRYVANSLLVEDGRITGEVGEPVVDGRAKRDLLDREAEALGLSHADCATIGDGANDRGMTEAAGLGVAWRGKTALREATPIWLDHTDLRGLLWLQGYSDDAIVTAGNMTA